MPPQGESPLQPPKTPVRHILSPFARDAIGILLVVVALLGVLGLWFHRAGPVGEFLAWAAHGAWGVAAFAFPLVGLYWGSILIRDTAREERVRMFIGFLVLCAGLLGLLSLLGGNPAPTAGYTAVAAAGGLMGAVVAHPLASVISGIGAAIVCLGLLTLGLLIFTGTPIAAVWARMRDFFTAADVAEREKKEDHQSRRARRRAEQEEEEALEEAEPEPAEPKQRWQRVRGFREAFGLIEPPDDDVVYVPESAPMALDLGSLEHSGYEEEDYLEATTRRSSPRTRASPRRAASRPHGRDDRRPVPATAARPAPRSPAVHGRRGRPVDDAERP